MTAQGAEGIIFGCTEIPLLIKPKNVLFLCLIQR
jgi:aspartate/glutamate racemase